jgi:hypothetical protein
MDREHIEAELVELGTVSEATQGFGFDIVETLGYMPKAGIRDE